MQPPKEPLPPVLFFHTLPAQTDVHRFCSVKRPQLSCGCMCEWGARLRYIQHVGGIMASFKKGNCKATFFSYRHEWGCCSVYFCVLSPKWLYSVSSCSIITWNLWVWPPKLSNEKLRSSQFVNKNKETPNKTPSDGFMSSQLLLMDSQVNANTWNHFTRVSSLIWAGWLFRIIDHQFVGESTHALWWPHVITSYKKLQSCDD